MSDQMPELCEEEEQMPELCDDEDENNDEDFEDLVNFSSNESQNRRHPLKGNLDFNISWIPWQFITLI